MSSLATVLLAFLLLGPSAATLDPNHMFPQAAGQPALGSPPAGSYPVDVHLRTVVDHAELLAGQFVRLPPSYVSHVTSATLVELRDAREHGMYHFHAWDEDRLLAVLPQGAHVSRGDTVVLAGRLRSVLGARATGDLTPEAASRALKHGHRAILIATTVSASDGASLMSGR